LPGYLLLRYSCIWEKTLIFWSCQWLKFQPASGWSGENRKDGDDDGEMALLLLVKGGGRRLVFFLLRSGG